MARLWRSSPLVGKVEVAFALEDRSGHLAFTRYKRDVALAQREGGRVPRTPGYDRDNITAWRQAAQLLVVVLALAGRWACSLRSKSPEKNTMKTHDCESTWKSSKWLIIAAPVYT